ncbi:uncharacterized protein LOC17883410 isoform X2 [Capsella rubella]|uniref:uncharacterized protein LOC17883410 isoform X2 n=1 Tax=Capsella rubella TaxID=81985 RepID=UPI000CD5A98A|nr:uncharacterized protein LOC17883410 isoform X2 [Capsella rubella]
MMDIAIDELQIKKDASESLTTAESQAPCSDRPMFWTICPFCAVRYRSHRSLLNKPSRCQSCYIKFIGEEVPVIGATPEIKPSQNHVARPRSNLVALKPKKQPQPQKPQSPDPSSGIPKFWTMCPFCTVRYRLHRRDFLNKPTSCQSCKMKFTAIESPVQGHPPGKISSQKTLPTMEKTRLSQNHVSTSNLAKSTPTNQLQPLKAQPQTVPFRSRPSFWTMCPFCEHKFIFLRKYINKWLNCLICKKKFNAVEGNFSLLQPKTVPSKNPGTHFSGKESFQGLSCVEKVGEKRKRDEYGESCNTENRSKSEKVIVKLSEDGSRRVSDDIGNAGEESGSGKEHYEVHICKETLPNTIKRNSQVRPAMRISQNLKCNNIRSDLLASTSKKQQEKAHAFSLQQKNKVPSKNPATHVSGKESSPCLSCAMIVGEKRKTNECCENCTTENQNKSEDVIGRDVDNNRRVFNDNGNVRRREEPGSGKQLHEVVRSEETFPNVITTDHKLNKTQDAAGNSGDLEVNEKSSLCDSGSEGAVQLETSEFAGVKFNDFDKLRAEVSFAVGQTWALYSKADGMPRLYADIRKVSAPSFGLRITYLEPDPEDEKEIQWFEEDLPVSVGKVRFGKSQNTKDRSIFSHVTRYTCKYDEESDYGRLSISPRKGETWALFKNWDINWSSEPDSHRKFEYEFVEILSDYTEGAGVSVAFLHKAKGFVSVFFRMGTGGADISQILPHSLYRFSHRIPSFKLTGMEGQVIPKDAYELDQAALPNTIEEKIVPSHLLAEPKSKPEKPEALNFPMKGKVFQTGQIWSFYSSFDNLHPSYCRIQRITLTQAFEQEAEFKLSVSRLKANPFPGNVIPWEDKRMPVGCGTFSVRKCFEILTPEDILHQIKPDTSMDGNEYTILPKIGDVWAIYRCWTCDKEFKDMGSCDYDIVEVLDDTLDYKVLAVEPVLFSNEEEDKTFFKAAESRHSDCNDKNGSEAILTVPKSEMLRFSHQIPASRVIKEIDGDLKELFEVNYRALPKNSRFQDH